MVEGYLRPDAKARTVKWLGRDTVRAPHLALCLTEKEFLQRAKHCKVGHPGPWLEEDRHFAVLHTWEVGGKLCCIVCLSPKAQAADPIALASALVHEAVHVFQRLCDSIGESEPGREFEAYSIERISEQLMREYARRMPQ